MEKQTLLLRNAQIIDGLGSVHEKLQDIYIFEGLISEIGEKTETKENVKEIDLKGSTVMPGIIDAHVHLQSVPGSVFRKDNEETLEKYRLQQLRTYLACGVTTVLDNAISSSMLRKFQEYIKSGGAGPSIYALGPSFYPPKGYLDNNMLTSYWGPQWRAAGSKEDIDALFREYEGIENIVGLKTMLERGFGKSKIWPVHSRKIRKIIVEEAKNRNLPIYIHAYKEKEQALGLEMGVYNFVHSGFLFKQPKDKFIEKMKELGAYVTTTISCTFDQMLVPYDPKRADMDFLQRFIPEEMLKTAENPDAWDEYYKAFFKNSSPHWMPDFIIRAIAKLVNIEKAIRSCMDNALKAIVKMHEAGIPIVVGTDASSWPVFLNFFHGTSTIREIEILGDAGIPPKDVIRSATGIPAEMMGISDKKGIVEKGKDADLIIVEKDPLKDLKALKNLKWVVKGGVIKTPDEWMEA